MAMTIKVNGAVFEFDEVSEYLEFAEATGLEGLPEEDSSCTPIKEPLGKDANGEYLFEGDYVTGTEDSPYGITSSNAICEVETESEVKVIQTTDDDTKKYEGESIRYIYLEEFVKLSDNLDEAKEKFDELNGEGAEHVPKFNVGDKVVIVDNFSCGLEVGDVGIIASVDLDDEEYDYQVKGARYSFTMGHAESELELVEDSPTEFRAGDIVRATEVVVGFGGEYVACNSGELLEVQIGGFGAMCLVKDPWKIAYVSENLANIELVCRREDRKDIEL